MNCVGGSVYANAMAQFAICRQPWNEYINLLTKQDATPYHVEPQEKPAYRGRKRGREGWLFGQQVQLHYHRFPDEHLLTNLTRWRTGETVGDIALQQFRNAQPFDIEDKDSQGMQRPSPEVYMKLNYKNPATISRFLTRTGHMYPADILPLNPEAVVKLRLAKAQAIRIGLYPRFGNPFWFRSQKFRPKAYQENYDPTTYSTKHTMEHFAYNWAQTDRIRRYFKELERLQKNASTGGRGGSATTAEQKQQDQFYSPENQSISMHRNNASYAADVERSIKNPTVPGLMSTKGMKKKFYNLYSSTSTKRMGFSNPTLGIKKV
ncbi:putative kinteoplast poly(A) polymerase complex 1 subunit [Trypanosoma rangeli]|uniref:Putative kinteoplast poly(A) polymerase complex 1 subunit n=2 Tax=Trypanosoma rangeli TaxID=5698 RepID=A0A422NIU3_TRYRA|nr:putative kinteoplast poly(A) polymerase complex 1 subunit [Trypanosoma rangeli]RNF05402.1 putative kinteoplast poly(A) polymerase complex 1 subunit [Trypanosoma rangeli]|eukprot:RNF05402.1 putative kinteoplast poly(A) polymerase complex 1 subunit [Trypanosoma rangeli]